MEKAGLRVDRGRIDPMNCRVEVDKCHVHVGSPFLGLCVQNGGSRDGLSRWFTCGIVNKGVGGATFDFSSRRSISLISRGMNRIE
jgi:hypothetical protein